MKPAELEKRINELLEVLHAMVPVSPGFRSDVNSLPTAQLSAAKEVILLPPAYARYVWYSVDVWLIASLEDENGNDRVIRIYGPGQIFTDSLSFFKAKPSNLKLTVLTKGTLLSLKRSAIIELKKHQETHELVTYILLVEQQVEAWRTRVMGLHDKDKVATFAAVYPMNKIPNKYGASFLNMVPANYSREKAAYNARNKD
ncbi:hypothetical protein IDJ77_22395 [Mucilaginibacter sp. ZT4R22]|uniref:Uncharacterized protein n=1 Tax=Mucilaginibacter pankratovii TaxID=2772110 RepID=A0ABR7WWB9_9SPHI|nr:hypothetical protein [Mucilaginibacter pankratovii]MBD1366581.1 hypothetical protein [Mucilaginibacter pankratovii]